MSRTGLDSSVVVAACLGWHEFHLRTRSSLMDAEAADERFVLPWTTLLQSYSVLTRLPRGDRVPPADARDVLFRLLGRRSEIVHRGTRAAWTLLDDAVARGVAGGAIHDYEILVTAASAGATRLLTLDPDDFLRFGDHGVAIVVP